MNSVAITAIVVGSLFAYLVIGGVVWLAWGKHHEDNEPLNVLGAMCWPVTPFTIIAWRLAKLLAFRLPAWIVARSQRRRSNLPRAEVRR